MADYDKKLRKDVKILVKMAEEMPDYLRSEVMFWRMMGGGMPMLTLGGFLMRQHRLLALPDLLAEDEWTQIRTAVTQFNAALSDKIVRVETKAHKELAARIRQWSESLKDKGSWGYQTAVETRLMIHLIVQLLESKPYQLESDIPSQIMLLDSALRSRFEAGDFVWTEAWQPAYPQSEYWWLYGRSTS